jgi:hypothetical protein
MATSTTYAIYWLPAGMHFEPSGDDASYQRIIDRFLSDIGGTPMYNIVTQYSYDSNHRLVIGGPILNKSTFGGWYVDTTPYPHAGSAADPVTLPDLASEVPRALHAAGWAPGADKIFFVFTAANLNICLSPGRCTVQPSGSAALSWCAVHGGVPAGGLAAIFAVMPAIASYDGCPQAVTGQSPNGDAAADTEVNAISHELFESVTDPFGGFAGGWYDGSPNNGEIGDKCQSLHDLPIAADGSDVTLHGHGYLLQAEWSNAAHGCALSYKTPRPKCKKGYTIVKGKCRKKR